MTPLAGSGYGVLGMGMYLPKCVVDNGHVAKHAGVSEEWILHKTGVEQRRRGSAGELTADLGATAARRALCDAGNKQPAPTRPEMVVFATSTPDRQSPAPVFDLHRRLGLPRMPALSIDAACAGFAQALITSYSYFRAGIASSALVVAATRTRNYLDESDRRVAALFGDGAGAFLLGAVPAGYGVLGFDMLTDSSGTEYLRTPLHGTVTGDRQFLEMDGRALSLTFAVELPRMLYTALGRAGVAVTDIDRLIMHQANVRMVEHLATALGLPAERVPTNGRTVGNTVSASLPITTVMTDRQRPLQRGDIVVFVTAGAGVSGAVIVLRWY